MRQFLEAITRSESVRALSHAAAALPKIQGRLLDAGLAGIQQGLVVSHLIDGLTRRVIALGESHLGPPPGPYAWLACGSQGRQEQTFHTDQDNALIMADHLPAGADDWFAELGVFVTDGLAACGISRCPGGIGPHRAEWRRTVSEWHQEISTTIRTPDSRAVMLASHYFDLRCVHGDASLLSGVRKAALTEAAANRLFLGRVKQNALRSQAGVGLFGRFRVKRRFGGSRTLDLKHQALLPVSQLALAYALAAGNAETSTAGRLRAASRAGIISANGARDLHLAFATATNLRARLLVNANRTGAPATNQLDLTDLCGLERTHLRTALTVIRRSQQSLGQGTGY